MAESGNRIVGWVFEQASQMTDVPQNGEKGKRMDKETRNNKGYRHAVQRVKLDWQWTPL